MFRQDRIGAVVVCALALVACREGGAVAERLAKAAGQSAGSAHPVLEPLLGAPRSGADEVGRFLGGLPLRGASPFAELEKSPEWPDHAAWFEKVWAKAETDRLRQMRKFKETAYPGAEVSKAKVFYPFSGPDVLTVMTLFPDNDEFVLAALEPPGTVPGAAEFPAEDLKNELPLVRSTLNSLLGKSFFVTREMDKQLRGQVTDGVLPVMLTQLARMNKTVLRWNFLTINDDGTLAERKETAPRAAFGKNRSVALELKDEATGRIQWITYVSLNVDDGHLESNEAFKKYIASLGPVNTLLKSTSYMTHRKEFSQIRNLILESSRLIVQDDSGVPYKDLLASGFSVDLYGAYTKPYASFAYMAQKDLRLAYETQAKPIDFRMGYGYGKVQTGVQVAKKK